jgi:tetratricopeptide repeat protein 30
LALIETLSKHMIIIKDDNYNEILNFLDSAELNGKKISTNIERSKIIHQGAIFSSNKKELQTVSTEARFLKKLFLKQLYE